MDRQTRGAVGPQVVTKAAQPRGTHVSVTELDDLSLGEFRGTERFSLIRCLGEGGMGTVYEALDHKRGARVALKTLLRAEPSDIQRLKREFRALSGVSHPNLVQLYELMSTDKVWFFTMELVEGVPLLEYVRPMGVEPPADSKTLRSPGSIAPARLRHLHVDRLRSVLRQLAEALSVLHAAGKLHRDIKPSNTLITATGRLVLLDFGLVTDPSKDWFERSTMFRAAGTPAYMSPEQFAANSLSTASDWYGVGAVLYQALCERLPHQDQARNYLELARARREELPIPPHELQPDVPEDLEKLCLDLLQPAPRARPTGQEVLKALNASAADSPRAPADLQFVAREPELAMLYEAFARCTSGRPVIQIVHGVSGIGKSALAEHFVDHVLGAENALTLRGRCYERESVPYKALDSVVDELSRFWQLFSDTEDELSTVDVGAVVHLFPTLVSVPDRPAPGALQRRELRRRAVSSLRAMLRCVADTVPLVLYIDDLQWGDADSARLLGEILDHAEAPPCLILLTCRGEQQNRCEFLGVLLAKSGKAEVRELVLGPLSDSAASTLAASMLRDDNGELADRIVMEAGGSPYIVHELARHVLSVQQSSAGTQSTHGLEDLQLEHALKRRLAELEPEQRRLLQVVALASGPIRETVACQAAGLTFTGQSTVLALSNARLLRSAGNGEGYLEVYHDRIREGVVANLTHQERSELHGTLADALRDTQDPDLAALGYHYQAAGKVATATEYAKQAAREAAYGLAFDRAARLCRLALGLIADDDDSAQSLRLGLAEALQNVGRSPEAAEAYLNAADHAPPESARELRQRAAEQLILSGHVDEGLATVGSVLQGLGSSLPKSRRHALLGLLWTRLQLRLRGVGYRAASDEANALHSRIDTYWGIGLYMSSIDPVRGAYFQARNLLLALRVGETKRIVRAMCVEASYHATSGVRRLGRASRLLERARSIAEPLDDAYLFGIVSLAEGIIAFMAEERWEKCGACCDRSERIFREHCRGVSWELSNGRFFSLNSRLLRGQLAALADRLPEALNNAANNGDLFAESFLRFRFSPMIRLAQDDRDNRSDDFAELLQRVSAREFYLQHYWERHAFVQNLLYRSNGREALATVEQFWPTLQRSLLTRMQFHRIDALHMRARCYVAAASELRSGSEHRAQVKRAQRDVVSLEKEGTDRSRGLALSIRAGVAVLQSDYSAAVSCLYRAADRFEAVGMGLHSASARLALGRLIGGDRGKQQAAEAETSLTTEGVRRPLSMASMLLPGILDRS